MAAGDGGGLAKKCIGRYVITDASKSIICGTSDRFPSGNKLFALDRAAVDCPGAVSRSTPQRLPVDCWGYDVKEVHWRYDSIVVYTRLLVHWLKVLSARILWIPRSRLSCTALSNGMACAIV